MELADGFPPYLHEEPTRALFNIVEKDPPIISNKWSIEFQDFVDCCLNKNPKKRWSAEALIEHPFLSEAAELKSECAAVFNNWKQ